MRYAVRTFVSNVSLSGNRGGRAKGMPGLRPPPRARNGRGPRRLNHLRDSYRYLLITSVNRLSQQFILETLTTCLEDGRDPKNQACFMDQSLPDPAADSVFRFPPASGGHSHRRSHSQREGQAAAGDVLAVSVARPGGQAYWPTAMPCGRPVWPPLGLIPNCPGPEPPGHPFPTWIRNARVELNFSTRAFQPSVT